MSMLHTAVQPQSQAYLDRFNAIAGSLPGADIDWLQARRQAGAVHLATKGLPTRKTEAWRYTSLRPIEALTYDWQATADTPDISPDQLPALLYGREAACRIVLVNGCFRADLSSVEGLPPGVILCGLSEAIARHPALMQEHLAATETLQDVPLMALNQAFMSDGFVFFVPENKALEQSVEILNVGTGGAVPPIYQPRNLIVLQAGARATVVEHHVGLCIGAYFANLATDIVVGQGASLRHCKVQDEAKEAFHITTARALLSKDSMFDSFVFTLGARLSRNEIRVQLKDPGASCRLNGAYLLRDDQHADHTTHVDHLAPDTSSKELYKGVLKDRARGVFQGKIIVHPDAQRSNGEQMNRALMLSAQAEVNSKPELEIYADDVKCAHGATVGQIDETALFYMRSRGVPENVARRLLVEAFLAEVIDGIGLTGMRLPLQDNVARWMGR